MIGYPSKMEVNRREKPHKEATFLYAEAAVAYLLKKTSDSTSEKSYHQLKYNKGESFKYKSRKALKEFAIIL
jgi:hypothetical protein